MATPLEKTSSLFLVRAPSQNEPCQSESPLCLAAFRGGYTPVVRRLFLFYAGLFACTQSVTNRPSQLVKLGVYQPEPSPLSDLGPAEPTSSSYAAWAPWRVSATCFKCAEMMPGLGKLPLPEIPAASRDAPQPSAQTRHQKPHTHHATAPGGPSWARADPGGRRVLAELQGGLKHLQGAAREEKAAAAAWAPLCLVPLCTHTCARTCANVHTLCVGLRAIVLLARDLPQVMLLVPCASGDAPLASRSSAG